ncbi:MAG: hypothetical protein K2X67_01755 [Burkholderiales bacterium]|jgi:hypothetical protein|nr:hypothetical protein [Burkholderiales bacterium]
MAEAVVIHLARAANGVEVFAAFMDSYKCNPGGEAHDFAVVFKGFDPPTVPSEYLRCLEGVRHTSLHVSDEGLDITAYQKAVTQLENYSYYCFLNSFSSFRDPDWLRKMLHWARAQDVGLVGATGSYQSVCRDFFEYMRAGTDIAGRPAWKQLVINLHRLYVLFRYWMMFPPFPNFHVRSNAFIVSKSILDRLRWPQVRSKLDAYRFESGRRSLTRQVLASGRRALVVGRDGAGYEKEDWLRSNTFWQHGQSNLLVEDNQTRSYALGDEATRRRLCFHAWAAELCDPSTGQTNNP